MTTSESIRVLRGLREFAQKRAMVHSDVIFTMSNSYNGKPMYIDKKKIAEDEVAALDLAIESLEKSL